MNVYALFPLSATAAYIPLLVMTIVNRPWNKTQVLFIRFLVAAMLWSLTDFFFRSNLFPQYNMILLRAIVILFLLVAVQLHTFTSSFYGSKDSRWLVFAYTTLVAVIVLVVLGVTPEEVVVIDDKLYSEYGTGAICLALPMLVLFARNMYVLRRRLFQVDTPVQSNQLQSLQISIIILAVFSLATFIPGLEPFPISHFGNILIAFILSYSTIYHSLVDIRYYMWRWLAWISMGILGTICYCTLLIFLGLFFNFEITASAMLVVSITGVIIAALMYRLRPFFFGAMGRVISGPSFRYRQELTDFTEKVHNMFSLEKQGGELLQLVTRALDCSNSCLLFLNEETGYFRARFLEPYDNMNPMWNLQLHSDGVIAQYLQRRKIPLIKGNLAYLSEAAGLTREEKENIDSCEIELFNPLISRDRLIGILITDKKKNGRYSLEDFSLLKTVASRVSVSMEKEYLREQLKAREEELSLINRSSAIMTSSFDVQNTYDSFILELRKVVQVSWAAVTLIEDNELRFLAVSSEIESAWNPGEHIPVKGTGTEYVARHNKSILSPDLTAEKRFVTESYQENIGLRSVLYIPLHTQGEVIGALIVASILPNAYSAKQVELMEHLASQIAMPIKNARLYAQTERMARIDEMTGLLNRRSLDEILLGEINRHLRYGGVFSVIMLDLDSFKHVNDSYGHLTGDLVLKQTGSTITSSIRSTDRAFRIGGDEFAIMLPQTTTRVAHIAAERVREQIVAQDIGDGLQVTPSIGIASWPIHNLSATGIFAAADAALYSAKKLGGNSIYTAETVCGDKPASPYITDTDDTETLSIIYALAAAVDNRHTGKIRHSRMVSTYATNIARALNMTALELNRVSTCALLHDVGKSGINNEILHKPGGLDSDEWETMKDHPRLGAAIVSHSPQLACCVPAIIHHHERWDGTGYPDHLQGEDIPLEARIITVADAFSAMVSNRPYAKSMTLEKALQEMRNGKGTQFDPELVELFIQTLEQREKIPV